jgi:predicted O-methyltransferase YrrM
MRLKKTHLLFLIILIEGYAVLASELLSIRLLLPFVGSGTDTVAIVISAVLLPLAVGYHAGGTAFRRHWRKSRASGTNPKSVRKLLLNNITVAMVFLTLGLSYPFLEFFFGLLTQIGLGNRLLQSAIYSAVFLIVPIYLLGQTVPLVSHYFSRTRLSEITGRMLFCSTSGSFLGSVFSTLVLMTYAGVHNTVLVTLGLLGLLAPLLAGRLLSRAVGAVAISFILAFLLNNPFALRAIGVVANNSYNIAVVTEIPWQEDTRELLLNRSHASLVSEDPEKRYAYIRYIDKYFLTPIAHAKPPRDILVIGAGGFTLGLEDEHNRYTYVDIDAELKEVAEQHFLKEKLTPNKRFEPVSARAFLNRDTERYDLIVIDVYSNAYAIPMECTTREFLQSVKARLKPDGVVIANIITDANFNERFALRYDNTFRSVFPHYARVPLGTFSGFETRRPQPVNMLYIYHHRATHGDTEIYTDDRNSYSLDR